MAHRFQVVFLVWYSSGLRYRCSVTKALGIDIMTEQQLITLYISQNQTIMTFWSIYGMVAIGLIGFVVQKGGLVGRQEKGLFSFIFLLFSASNAYPLYFSMKPLVWISSEIKLEVFRATDPMIVIGTHIIFDIIVLFVLCTWSEHQIDLSRRR